MLASAFGIEAHDRSEPPRATAPEQREAFAVKQHSCHVVQPKVCHVIFCFCSRTLSRKSLFCKCGSKRAPQSEPLHNLMTWRSRARTFQKAALKCSACCTGY